MRKITTVLLLLVGSSLSLQAQLPEGTIATDFNVRDINGNQHHLYSYLNQGKTVILDFSAAWCPLCWTYHNSKALSDFYTLYGPDGSDDAMVLFIERDEQMGIEDLRGNTNATVGDWITGTPYPIIDTSVMNADYQPNALPTIYGVHPDRRVTTLRTPSTDELRDFMLSFEPQDSMGMMDTMIEVTVRNFRDVSCFGASDGLIDIEVDGPADDFTYLWSNGDTTQDISGLPGGTYSCVIIDNLGNQVDLAPVPIVEPDSLSVEFLTNTPSSLTASDGSLIANIRGGIQPYSYIWGDESTGNTLANIGVGNYSVMVTDANGCTASGSIDLEVPTCALFLAINIVPATCDENADGEVNILVERAQGAVTFAWNNGATTQNIQDLPSGGYEVTVTDAVGCSAIAGGMVTTSDNVRPVARIRSEFFTVYLNQDGEAFLSGAQVDSGSFDNCSVLGLQLSQEEFDCSDIGRNFLEFAVIDEALNMTRREIEVTVLDTISPYWICPDTLTIQPCNGIVDYTPPTIVDNCPLGATTTISGPLSGSVLQPGDHAVTYTHITPDGNRTSCTLDLNVQPWITGDLVVNDAKCAGENSGSATVIVSNSTDDYTYNWSDGQTTGAAVNLAAGNYSVTVEDTTECTFQYNFFVGEPVEIFARVDSILSPDGRGDVYITVFGGTPPYDYEWILDGQVRSTVRNPQNLDFGLYTLRVTDSEDCVKDMVGIRVDASTSNHDDLLAKAIKIAPNPSTGTFDLFLPTHVVGKTGKLSIANLMGQVLWTRDQPLQSIQRLAVGDLPGGTYFLQVIGEAGQATRQIVIYD